MEMKKIDLPESGKVKTLKSNEATKCGGALRQYACVMFLLLLLISFDRLHGYENQCFKSNLKAKAKQKSLGAWPFLSGFPFLETDPA